METQLKITERRSENFAAIHRTWRKPRHEICRYKTLWMRIFERKPSSCLDVIVSMLNCVFWKHILQEIEFKSRGDMGSDGIAHRYHP